MVPVVNRTCQAFLFPQVAGDHVDRVDEVEASDAAEGIMRVLFDVQVWRGYELTRCRGTRAGGARISLLGCPPSRRMIVRLDRVSLGGRVAIKRILFIGSWGSRYVLVDYVARSKFVPLLPT